MILCFCRMYLRQIFEDDQFDFARNLPQIFEDFMKFLAKSSKTFVKIYISRIFLKYNVTFDRNKARKEY